MSTSTSQTLQLLAWYLAVAEFVLMLYTLLLNPRHRANRLVAAFLAVIALNTLSIGQVLDPTPLYRIGLPLYVATATVGVVGLLIVTVMLVKFEWLPAGLGTGAQRLWWLVYGLGVLPAVLTLIDVASGTRLWYTPPAGYAGGFVPLRESASGIISGFLRGPITYVMGSLPILLLGYLLARDRKMSAVTRRLVWLLLVAQVIALVMMSALHGPVLTPLMALIVSVLYTATFAYAVFRQMISERRAQAGRVQTRLTVLLLAVALPLFAGLIFVLISRADAALRLKSDEQLATANLSVISNTTTWLDLNVAALNQLVLQPQIIGMDAAEQKPILEAMAVAHPQMYLVSTTDPQGMNVARNDAGDLTDYSDRAWYKGAIGGASLTLQSLIGRTTGRPALVASMPILREPGAIVGVGMFASELTDVARQVQLSTVGEAGFSYVVDAGNLVVAYPETMPAGLGDIASSVPITPLGDLSDYPPVKALRSGSRGRIEFTDEAGQQWQAYVDEMEYGWGVIVQQPSDDFLSALRGLQQVSLLFVIGGVLLLFGLTVLAVRQALMPVGKLTETAVAIAGGDLELSAPVESEDEFGALGQAFNRMTGQLRELINSLEQRVAERTVDLEHRAVQLAAVAEVGRAATSTLDPGKLAQQTVDLLRERFDLYYVGLFLVDEVGEYAVLEAGTGEPGRMMKEQGHKLLVGGGSMVGAACAERKAHIALDVGAESVRFANPLLPDTRSEMALPLAVGGRVLGALDVQSVRPAAFSDEDIAVMQLAADQVAVAVDNARKFSSEATLLEAASPLFAVSRRLTEVITTDQAVQAIIDSVADTEADGCAVARFGFSPDGEVETITFLGSWNRTGVSRFPIGTPLPASMSMLPVPMMSRLWIVADVLEEAQMPADMRQALAQFGARAVVNVPLQASGRVIGVVIVQRATPGPFSPVSLRLYETLVEQAAVVLERARLVEETQRRAAQERWLSQVSDQMQRADDVRSLLQVAAEEVNRELGGSRAYVQLGRREDGRQAADDMRHGEHAAHGEDGNVS